MLLRGVNYKNVLKYNSYISVFVLPFHEKFYINNKGNTIFEFPMIRKEVLR